MKNILITLLGLLSLSLQAQLYNPGFPSITGLKSHEDSFSGSGNHFKSRATERGISSDSLITSYLDTLTCYVNEAGSQRITRVVNWRGSELLYQVEIKDVNNNWLFLNRTSRTFNEFGEMNEELFELWGQAQNWVNDSRISYTYDAKGNLLITLDELWEGNVWKPSTRVTRSYDASGNILVMVCENHYGNNWAMNYKYTYEYTSDGKISALESLIYIDDTVSQGSRLHFDFDLNGNLILDTRESLSEGVWTYFMKTTYTYNADNLMLDEVSELWQTAQWVPDHRYEYSYNNKKWRIEEIVKQWNLNEWKNSYRTYYEYNGTGMPTLILQQSWLNEAWTNYSREMLDFDVYSNLKSDRWDLWENDWVSNSQYLYTYNSNSDLLSQVFQMFDVNHWADQNRLLFTYDEYGNSLSGRADSWIGNSWIPESSNYIPIYQNGVYYGSTAFCSRYEAHFRDYNTGISPIIQVDPLEIKVFPNPVEDYLSIQIQSRSIRCLSCEIYTLKGELVLHKDNLPAISEIGMSQLPAGVYILRVSDGTHEQERRIVKR